MSNIIEKARSLRAVIENLSVNLEDSEAASSVELFPKWGIGKLYVAGDRVQYNGVLYKALSDHEPQETWSPDLAPSLWAKVLIPNPDVIPEWEQPDSTNAYMTGDKVMYNGVVYKSIIDNNVWSPEAYPAGWEVVQ